MNYIFNFPDPKFTQETSAETLVVMLHAYSSKPDDLDELRDIVCNTYEKNGVHIYSPTLPYSHKLDSTGANPIVVKLAADLDCIWNSYNKYKKVIFIGHSLGGILLRRLFLAGAPNPPDYSDGLLVRDDLKSVAETNHPWAAHVDRIILLASWDSGWSIRTGEAWKYWFGLNLLGFWGRFSEIIPVLPKALDFRGLGRTMLDMRLGAPFIVQTRLLWMAYRRWHSVSLRGSYNQKQDRMHKLEEPPKEAVNPLVIQIIGTQDDFVSPLDQVVDHDIEEAAKDNASGFNSQFKKYYLLEMPYANHKDVINLNGQQGKDRTEIFQCALSDNLKEIENCARNPAYFEDRPIKPDSDVQNVVFVMHGIRDDGYWTHRIAKAVKEEASLNKPDMQSWCQTYGYFPMGAFLLPWIRQRKVEWFMDKYVSVKACYPNATMHYVGHSNGTYLAAKSLEDYPAARFGRIYFAGSVVHPHFDWSTKISQRSVDRFHNARGATDWVVALLPKSVEYFTDLGGAGFDGFIVPDCHNNKITQSEYFAKGGHGGAIQEGHWSEIAKFIVTGKKPFASDEPGGLFQQKQARWLDIFSRFRIGIPLAFTIAALLGLFVFSLWLPCEYRHWPTLNLTEGWNKIWIGALAAFLMLQIFLKQVPKPEKEAGKFSLLLMLISIFGTANLIFTSFFADSSEFSKLDPSRFDIANHTAGAYLTLVGFIMLIRFILTRF